ncbi:tyrosine--tRNA ligase [candidate division WWE3 bacterium CG08_land_8_20_14_0_20_41_10]|uniref:Tyrosine--tRNA ligase n=1 Tax=candidate division WWE3 bacterium CG08_land_8_20_14_0_20_41_10 TaxID=1975085 RepID=A0A2H0XCP8_UNCKA|nr:MAG: tyrosine--tRNA ligase [candidate division WWE3 bacterium CG08_land_8_20_14_0_20_41_10]
MPKIITDPKLINDILTRGVHEIFTPKDLKEQLLSGKQLHLKLGIDVTGPLLHLGHSVVQRKIRDFQELGHRVTLIIGDFTTLVGDHSDKVDMRGETSSEEIKRNEQSYVEQFCKTVHKENLEIRHNSEWLKPLNFNDVIGLAKNFTIAQMLERETFMLRYKAQKPIGLDEFMYPLMQGYDSVALNCDIEFGGTDQTFNLLAGRQLMEAFGQKPQVAFVTKLLTGSDGRPMGKSLKNFIPILDNPTDMYGKVMSIVDEIIWEYFELVTRVPSNEIDAMKLAVKEGDNPMKYKKILAKNIVEFYHGEKAGLEAEKNFENTVQNKEVAQEDVLEVKTLDGTTLLEFLKTAVGSKYSTGDIKRTIEQGGVEVGGEKIIDLGKLIDIKPNTIIKFGKREFFRPVQ